jgi:transcriptional regulator with XRE-family HTH domain
LRAKAKTLEEIAAVRGNPEGTREYVEERAAVQIGRLLRGRRHEARLTQAQLAERMGVSQPEIARLEAGAVVPKVETLTRVASALNRELLVGVISYEGFEAGHYWRLETPEQAGEIVRELRKESGLTQTELAKKMRVKQPNVARLERGASIPHVRTLALAARVFGGQLFMDLVKAKALPVIGSTMLRL